MEFGLFCGGYIPASMSASDPHTRLMSEADLCVVGDQHNWKYAWLTEHHFLTEYSHISANEVLAPHVLARTEKIHVGSGIINVTPPVNHPARVAERVAMLDHLSSGRFEFGTGRGNPLQRVPAFGQRQQGDAVTDAANGGGGDGTHQVGDGSIDVPGGVGDDLHGLGGA